MNANSAEWMIQEELESFDYFKREETLKAMEHRVWEGLAELEQSLGDAKYKFSCDRRKGVIELPADLPACLRRNGVYVRAYNKAETDSVAYEAYFCVYDSEESDECVLGGEGSVPAYIDTIRYGYVDNDKPCKTEVTIGCAGKRYYFTLDKFLSPALFRNVQVYACGSATQALTDKTLFHFRPAKIYIRLDAPLAAVIRRYEEESADLFFSPKFERNAKKEDKELHWILQEKNCLDLLDGLKRERVLQPGPFKVTARCTALDFKIEERGTICVFESEDNIYKGKTEKKQFDNPKNFTDLIVRIEGVKTKKGEITIKTIVPVGIGKELSEMGCSDKFIMEYTDLPKEARTTILKRLYDYIESGGDVKMLGKEDDVENSKVGIVYDYDTAKRIFSMMPQAFPAEVRAGAKTSMKRAERGSQRTENQNVVSTFVSYPYDTKERECLDEESAVAALKKKVFGADDVCRRLVRAYNSGETAVLITGVKGSGKTNLISAFAELTEKEKAFYTVSGDSKNSLLFGTSRGYSNGSEGTITREITQYKGNLLLVIEDVDKAEEEMLSQISRLSQGHYSDLFLETRLPVPNSAFLVYLAEDADDVPDFFKRGLTMMSMPEYTTEEKKQILAKVAKERGCKVREEVLDCLAASAMENGVADLITDLNKIVVNGKDNISVAEFKEILHITDEFSFPFYAPVEEILRYFRYHKSEYSIPVRERVKKVYSSYCKEKNPEEKKKAEYVLTSLLRVRDALPCAEEITAESVKDIRRELDESHFDMKKSKEAAIRGLLAISHSKRTKALLFVGPPGCGKTSFCETLGRAFHRPLRKLNCNGMTTASQLSGVSEHQGCPRLGKIEEAFSMEGTTKLILMLDEIDKVKDPFVLNAFYDLLDSNEHGFWANGLGTYIDVSNTMFVLTANSLENVPSTVLDRCEIVRLFSYTSAEKTEIAKRHILPKLTRNYGMDVSFTNEAVTYLVENYCLAPGVRDVYRNAEAIFSSMIMQGETEPGTVVTPEMVSLLAPPKPLKENWFPEEDTPVGCVRVLATCGGAGCLSSVQVTRNYLGSGISVSGNVDETTRESVNDALNVCAGLLEGEELPPLSIRYSEGGVKKSGFSAGVSNVVACISFLLNKPVDSAYCMTGEIDTKGNIYPIGGVSDKLAAALDGGLKTVFLPEKNYRTLAEEGALERFAKLDIRPVRNVEEVLDVVFDKKWRKAERS